MRRRLEGSCLCDGEVPKLGYRCSGEGTFDSYASHLLIYLDFSVLTADVLGQGMQPLSDFVSTTKRKIDDANGPSDENRNRERKKKKKKHAKKQASPDVAVINLADEEDKNDS